MRPFENDQIITLTTTEIEARIDHVLSAPKDEGRLEMIVRRPAVNAREVVEEGELDREQGLLGDNWLTRGSSRTDNGLGHPEMQLNVMSCRFAMLIAGSRERVPLAGDQLFVDLDLSSENLPPGTRIKVGGPVIEVTAIPHTGCKKFVERFGLDAMKFANSVFGRRHNLRGINAKVIEPGSVRTGDAVVVTSRPLRDA
ncbi:MAG: MOSC domain-containing protein [Acidobacteria bacterium]|nr:MOSC domain-containing protein [Acidobacteriota bacterium]